MLVMNECLTNLELDRDRNTQLNKVRTSENTPNNIICYQQSVVPNTHWIKYKPKTMRFQRIKSKTTPMMKYRIAWKTVRCWHKKSSARFQSQKISRILYEMTNEWLIKFSVRDWMEKIHQKCPNTTTVPKPVWFVKGVRLIRSMK